MKTLGAAAVLALASSLLAPAPVGAVPLREPIKMFTMLSGTTSDWTYSYKLGPGFDDFNGKPGMCAEWYFHVNADPNPTEPQGGCVGGWHKLPKGDSYIIPGMAGSAGPTGTKTKITVYSLGTRTSTDRVVLTYAKSPLVIKIPKRQSRVLTMHGVTVRWFNRMMLLPSGKWLGEVTIKTQEQRCRRISGRKKCLWKTTGKLTTNSII